MTLNTKDKKELQNLYLKEWGIKLTDGEAEQTAKRLIKLLRLIEKISDNQTKNLDDGLDSKKTETDETQEVYNINGKDYMSITTAADYLGISRAAVYLYLQRGYFTTIRIENLHFIAFDELTARKQRLQKKATES